MSRNIEIEFKNMVDRESFIKLLNFFHIAETDFITQKNHYFDTNGLSLGQKKSALRIREIDGRFELTMKKIAEIGILEINQSISGNQAVEMLDGKAFPSGEISDELILMGVSPATLEYKGVLQTKRAHASFKSGQLMFDHSTYLGKEDFEIEYEVPEQYSSLGENEFNGLLIELNIPRTHADNKIKRFFDAKKEDSH